MLEQYEFLKRLFRCILLFFSFSFFFNQPVNSINCASIDSESDFNSPLYFSTRLLDDH